MYRMLIYTLLLGATVPVSVRYAFNIFDGFRHMHSDEEHVSGHPAARLCLLLLGVYVQSGWWRNIQNDLKARSLGCRDPPVYPHKDPILGFDIFLHSVQMLKQGKLLETLRERIAVAGHTHYSMTLGQWALMTDEPENIKTIHATRFDDWSIAGPRLMSVIDLLGPRSIFASNGEVWSQARHMIRPSFVRDQVADLQSFDRHIGNLLNSFPAGGATVDIQALLMKMTMDSSTDFLLGYSTNLLTTPNQDAQKFIRAFEHVAVTSAHRVRLGWLTRLVPNREYARGLVTIRNFVESYMREAGVQMEKAGAVGARERGYIFFDELVKSGAPGDYIRDQIMSIIIAGRDTTAGSLTAAFYYLARNPEAYARLRGEAAGLGGEDPTWEQLKGLIYMSYVLKEALRLFPPVATNSRQANKDTVLPKGGGPDGQSPVFIPKGMTARYSMHSLHRRKDLWGEDAEEFRPERWETHLPGWDYIPFSGGPRICLGQQFALTQMSLVLYRVTQRYKAIEPRQDDSMRLKTGTTMTFMDGCQVGFIPV